MMCLGHTAWPTDCQIDLWVCLALGSLLQAGLPLTALGLVSLQPAHTGPGVSTGRPYAGVSTGRPYASTQPLIPTRGPQSSQTQDLGSSDTGQED